MTTSSVDGDNFFGFSNTGDANSAWGIGRRNTGEFWIANYTGNFLSGTRTTPLVIASTGAATFSSSVTVGGNVVVPFQSNAFIGSSADNGLVFDGSGNYGLAVNSSIGLGLIFESDGGTAKDFFIGTGNSDPDSATKLLTINTTGAAKFSAGVGISGATAPASGIEFPATQVASASANNLDDYEEGTFTATITPSTSGTITSNATFTTWSYTKIGKQVTINGVFVISSTSLPIGINVIVGGLPFTVANSFSAFGALSATVYTSLTGLDTVLPGRHSFNTTQLTIGKDASTFSANDELYITATYFV
jgi:hypothetical protein